MIVLSVTTHVISTLGVEKWITRISGISYPSPLISSPPISHWRIIVAHTCSMHYLMVLCLRGKRRLSFFFWRLIFSLIKRGNFLIRKYCITKTEVWNKGQCSCVLADYWTYTTDIGQIVTRNNKNKLSALMINEQNVHVPDMLPKEIK